MRSRPYFARQISELRRIGLPKDPARDVGIGTTPGLTRWVTVRKAPNCSWALMIYRTNGRDESLGKQNPDKPRQVTPTLQVTLPARSLKSLGLAPGDWVYVRTTNSLSGFRLVPAERVGTQRDRRATTARRSA